AVEGQAVVEITPERQQLIGVKTGKVGWREMTTVIRTVGRIGYDPELYTTIKEYREAIKAREKIKENPLPEVLKQADSLVENAYHKLRRLGLNDELIQEFSQDKEIPISLLHAQAGDMAWVYAQIYEYESALVEPGQEIEITSLVFPGRTFRGAVKSIDTVLDPMTRSVKVRAEIANPDGFLKPEMFVNVTIYIHLGRKLAIPEDAVLDTGERKLVFLSLGEGKFAPREVKLGYSAEGYYEITSGLREGDKVVTSANFLIDSESKLKSAISGMGEHKH
ncbi:MAG TPA: hypothetical protein DHV62_06615, partial [Elusimicrobia bacterium]|nr:hypothetical protein [Elusimicrobiota bacterium]